MAQVENTGLSEEQADLRSKDRRKFCRDVLEVAKALGRKLTVDPNWKRMKEDKIVST